MLQRKITVVLFSPPTLEDSRSARILSTETFTTKAQDTRPRGRARDCVLTTRTIESAIWSGGPVVHGSKGVMASLWFGFLGVLGGRVVDLIAWYTAVGDTVGDTVVRLGGYAGVVHGIGYVR